MTIKRGDILEFRVGIKRKEARKVLGVCNDVYFISHNDDLGRAWSYMTYKELLGFGLIVKEEMKEEKWVPEIGNRYWYIDSARPNDASWVGDSIDNQRRKFLGVYPNEESAQKVFDACKKAIENL